MKDLIDFLRAQLDEDQRIIRAVWPGRHGERLHWRTTDYGTIIPAENYGPDYLATGPYDSGIDDDIAAHIVRHDPARALREVAAKRAIIDEHTCSCPRDCGECGACSGAHHSDPVDSPCQTLKILAAVYSDHPDYRPEWAPDTPE